MKKLAILCLSLALCFLALTACSKKEESALNEYIAEQLENPSEELIEKYKSGIDLCSEQKGSEGIKILSSFGNEMSLFLVFELDLGDFEIEDYDENTGFNFDLIKLFSKEYKLEELSGVRENLFRDYDVISCNSIYATACKYDEKSNIVTFLVSFGDYEMGIKDEMTLYIRNLSINHNGETVMTTENLEYAVTWTAKNEMPVIQKEIKVEKNEAGVDTKILTICPFALCYKYEFGGSSINSTRFEFKNKDGEIIPLKTSGNDYHRNFGTLLDLDELGSIKFSDGNVVEF